MIVTVLLVILGAGDFGDVPSVTVVAIYDGDTFTVDVAGWPPIIGQRVQVRVAGVDTPEMTAKDPATKARAQAAKQRLVGLLRSAKVVSLHAMRRDKYFRILAVVRADGVDVAGVLIKEGLGKPYQGGKR
jgi:micrococcal nuclease